MSHNSTSGSNYIPTLDGWRAIAIILVLIAHGADSYFQYFCHNVFQSIDGVKSIGLTGVKLFFGLSGFLITTKLLEEEMRNGKISVGAFYSRRCFRILPAATIFLVAVGLLALFGILDVSLGRWLSTLFFASNYSFATETWYLGHFWSLAVEEHFYLLWPIVFFLLCNNKSRLKFVVSSFILIAIWRAIDFKFKISGSSSENFWGRTDIQVDGILGGVLVALLYFEQKSRALIDRLFSYRYTWWLLLVIFLVSEFTFSLDWKLKFLLLSFKALLIPFLLLGTVVNSSSVAGRMLELSAFRWLGHISYSLYLWQQLFFVWSDHKVAGLKILQMFPINLLVAVGCAYLSLKLVEKPFISLGHRLAARIT